TPKVKVLDGAKVAVTIDSNGFPYKVLLIRGTANVQMVDGITPEYKLAAARFLGAEGGSQWVANMAPITPTMARISITPEWVGVQDFEQRFPNAVEKAMGM